MNSNVTRRDFVKTGAGLVIAFHLPPGVAAGSSPAAAGPGFAPNAWLRVGTDGIVTLTVDKSEMGQGSQTGLAMILAEELEADWSTVRLGPFPRSPVGWPPPSRPGGTKPFRTPWDPCPRAAAPPPELRTPRAAEA